MNEREFVRWASKNLIGESYACKKDQVYVLSCGTKTYTWIVKEGVMFTALQTETSEGELANSIWRKNNVVHSFDDDIMLPFHALTDAVIVRYSSEEFNKAVQQSAELSWWLARHYHDQFTYTLSNYRHAVLDTSEERLRYLEDRFAQIEELDGTKISDSILSLFMGMHRVSINRIRKNLEKRSGEQNDEQA